MLPSYLKYIILSQKERYSTALDTLRPNMSALEGLSEDSVQTIEKNTARWKCNVTYSHTVLYQSLQCQATLNRTALQRNLAIYSGLEQRRYLSTQA
jgi:hypothetical protein